MSESARPGDGYVPAAFRVDDRERLAALIDAAVFATLVSNGPQGPMASHLPMLLRRGPQGDTLHGHLARANEHWRYLAGEPVLILFQGPEHYVSPSWYPSKAATGKVVPTWNYVMVQARGLARVSEAPERLRWIVGALTDHMERQRAEPWAVEDAPADYVERMLGQIVGIDVPVDSLIGKFKLGQNRSPADRDGLTAGLAAERPAVAAALAGLPAQE